MEHINFDRSDTKAIKGAAVLLMLFHHLTGFPYRFPVGFGGFSSVIPAGYLEAFGTAAKICVPMFFFLGGYGLYCKWKSGSLSITKSILSLYRSYWKVFFVFVPVALVFFRRSGENISPLCAIYDISDPTVLITTLISDFTAFTSTLNGEWWFLRSYICILPLGWLFCRATRRSPGFWADLMLVLAIELLTQEIVPAVAGLERFSGLSSNLLYSCFLALPQDAVSFFLGIVFARADGLCKLKAMVKSLPCSALVSCVGIGVLFWSRSFLQNFPGELFYCPLLTVLLSVVLDQIRLLKKGFLFLGGHSTNIWLIHSFYCYYFLEVTKIVYGTKNLWIDLAVLLALSVISSLLLEQFYAGLGRLAKTVRRGAAYTKTR